MNIQQVSGGNITIDFNDGTAWKGKPEHLKKCIEAHALLAEIVKQSEIGLINKQTLDQAKALIRS